MTAKISEMDAATTPLVGTEEMELVQGGATVKGTVADLAIVRSLAATNALVSDATLIDTADARLSDARTPTAHDLDSHGAATLAELNGIVSDATLIDTADARLSDARTPSSHGLGGSEHSTATLAQLTAKVSDATLARTDATQTFTGAQQTGVTTLTDAATIAVNAAANNAFKVTITAARILGNPTSAVQGMSWTVEVIQDGTGGRALTFGANYVGPAVTGPLNTSSDTAGQIRLLSCYAHSATKISVIDMGEAV